MKPQLLLITVILTAFTAGNKLYAQLGIVDSGISKVSHLVLNLKPGALKAIDKQYTRIEYRLTKQSEGYLKRLEKVEEKLKKKIAKTDSLKALKVFGDTKQRYGALRARLQQTNGKVQGLTHYIPGLDSIYTATKYLTQLTARLPNYSPEKLQLLQQLNGNLSKVQQQMQAATDIKQLLRQRKEELMRQLQNSVIAKKLDGFNKEVYYYQQQLNEYRDILNNPDKLARKALTVLRETPVFKDFMSRYGMLAQLFPRPDNYGTSQALAGLQTRAQVTQQVAQLMGSSGSGMNPQQYAQQQLQGAQTEMNQLKDKINKLGGGSSDVTLPDFKPNNQKTKSFWKRMEYGLNMQSQRPNGLLPVTTDMALTIGYKLNDKSIMGIGVAYKMGWGKDINHIGLSNQGIGLRSYVDIKLKGSIWMTGGYEQNYMQGFEKIPLLNDYSKWQQSGVIGLSKKYKVGKKTGNMQLLWDFLSYKQIPRTTELKFRLGYQL